MELIRCSKCGLEKDADGFHWANKNKGIRKTECKDCRSIKQPPRWTNKGRVCNKCLEFKDLDSFKKRKNGSPDATCKVCIKMQRQLKSENYLGIDLNIKRVCFKCNIEKNLDSYPKNKNCSLGHLNICKICYSKKASYSRYALTDEDFENMLLKQNRSCLICKIRFESRSQAMVDHDHTCCPGRASCGKCVRGLLCNRCNSAIGFFDDDPDRITVAAQYLYDRVEASSDVFGVLGE